MVALIPNTTNMGSSEARNAVADAIVAQWGTPDSEAEFSIEDMRRVSLDTIKEIQRVLGDSVGDLANVLTANENNGYAGRLSAFRAAARRVIKAADSVLGGQ